MDAAELPRDDSPELATSRILVVDDQRANVVILERLLANAGYSEVECVTDPRRAAAAAVRFDPDLVLLDLHMPGVSGFDVLTRLGPIIRARSLPVLVQTADAARASRRRALALGARDFVTKPIDAVEFLLRVRNLLHARRLQLDLEARNVDLARGVVERSRDLSHARVELLERLALAAEYRDEGTHEHTLRVGRASAHLARALGQPMEFVEAIERAAALHDIGKIGIPDAILLKPGPLTEEEFAEMRSHCEIGARILSGSRSSMVAMGAEIALTHHEHWNGRGYPTGLSGAEIPLPGRIVGLADVFDALAHDRPYKRAWPLDEVIREIASQSGQQFDPEVVEAFRAQDHEALLKPARP
jgi:putative two-component system response regulator